MMTQCIFQIREATPEEDVVIANHFYQMWLDLGVPAASIEPNWLHITLQYIAQARQMLHYQAFVAQIEGQIVGSTSCQRFAGLYPLILKLEHRNYGYIWGVYVESPYRQHGIATELMQRSIGYLRSICCTHAILNASPQGKPIYDRLGFMPANSMELKLI